MMTYHAQFLLLVVAGWVNRQQQDVIDYLQEENRVLRAGLRGKRLKLSDADRRRLAVKAQALGREALAQIASVATSATLLKPPASYDVERLAFAIVLEYSGCVPRFVEKERRPPLRHQGIRSGGNLRVFENLAQTLVAVDAP